VRIAGLPIVCAVVMAAVSIATHAQTSVHDRMLQREQLIPFNADDLERMGQDELAHGWAEEALSGFATEPGYVINYTTGRLQLENLLGDYMKKMGARGSLHDFHDRLLSYGTTPFSIVAPELLADLDKPVSQVRAAANY